VPNFQNEQFKDKVTKSNAGSSKSNQNQSINNFGSHKGGSSNDSFVLDLETADINETTPEVRSIKSLWPIVRSNLTWLHADETQPHLQAVALCDPGVEFSMEQYQVHMLRSNLFHAKDRYQGFLGQGGPATESSQSAILAQVKADCLADAGQPVVLEGI
jgi:hypothetical protein